MNRPRVVVCVLVLLFCSFWASALNGIKGQNTRSLSQSEATALIEGIVIDLYGNLLRDVLLVVLDVVSGTYIDTMYSDDMGYFRSVVPSGQYTIGGANLSSGVALHFDPRERIGVSAGDSVRVVLNAQEGRGLRIKDVRFNSIAPRLICVANTEFTISFSYQIWAPFALPMADEHISVGFGPDMKGVLIIGTPGSFPGVSGSASMRVRAPERVGNYTLYVCQSSISNKTNSAIAYDYRLQWRRFTDPSFLYSQVFIPLGIIEVTEPAGMISGQIVGLEGLSDNPVRVSFVSLPSGRVVDSIVVSDVSTYEMHLLDSEYAIRCEQVTNSTTYLLETRANIIVSGPDSARCDLDFTDCTSLTLHAPAMGNSDTGIEAKAGELVELTCDYELQVGSDQQHHNQYIAVGIEGSPQDVRIIRRQYGVTVIEGEERFKIQAPLEEGTYQVYAMLVNGFMTRDALDAYSDRFEDVDFCYIRIGTITVR